MSNLVGEVKIDSHSFEEAAVKYRGPLVKIPVLSLNDLLRYMTCRLGVQGTEVVGTATGKAQLAPYKAGRRQAMDLNIVARELVTYFGSCNVDFEPNSAISTVLGHHASQAMGDAQAKTPTALEVLSLIVKSIGEDLRYALFYGVRNPDGDRTIDLFDGFITILNKEMKSGAVSEAKKNMVVLPKVTNANACDVIKQAMFSLHPTLRREECFLFCSVAVADAYNESYLMSHTGLVYNDKYEQTVVEGSHKKLIIVPVPELEDDIAIITTKENMLIGMDQLSDKETVRVKEFGPDVLTLMMRLFFGTQFESIDERRLKVVVFGNQEQPGGDDETTEQPGGDDEPEGDGPEDAQ
ncbi:MAG: hypothetical protein K2H86_06060 [Muribaculaceae bacterium]|nr:hypothetical protein [Muribaculaceae bacterium]